MNIKLKSGAFLVFFITTNCFAVPSLSSNPIPVQDSKRAQLQNKKQQAYNPGLTSAGRIPEVTYRYLENVFSSFYKKLTFNTAITDSTFKDSLNSELISVPLIATNKQGLQMELFGNFSNPDRQYLTNLSADHALHDYIANSEQIDFYNSDLSIGAGISFNAGQSSKIKVIISNNEMPGYGHSKALLGFETRF